MGKKKPAAPSSVRVKAQEMREAQERADRRMRNIVIAVVTVVVVAVVAVVGVVVHQQVSARAAVENADPTEVLGPYADGAPIVVSHLGLGQKDDSLPTLVEYFDYSCHVCANVDVLVGQTLTDEAKSGSFNIEYQPVTTVDMPWQRAALTASFIVAQKDPDNWSEFHHALLAYFAPAFNAGDGTVIQNLEKSVEQVKAIATQVGVPEDVVATFPSDAVDAYLETTTAAWKDADVTGRESGLGTPEFVASLPSGKTHITLTSLEASAILADIHGALGVDEAAATSSDGAQSSAQ